jgi:hypothetical protein
MTPTGTPSNQSIRGYIPHLLSYDPAMGIPVEAIIAHSCALAPSRSDLATVYVRS